jgi:hypothetical protein
MGSIGIGEIVNLVLAAVAVAALFIGILDNRQTAKMIRALSAQSREMQEQNNVIQEKQLKSALFDKRYKLLSSFIKAAISKNHRANLHDLIEVKPIAAALFNRECLDIIDTIYQDLIMSARGSVPDYRQDDSEEIDFAFSMSIIERVNKILYAIKVND